MTRPKTTKRLCSGLTAPGEAPCRPDGRWFLVGPVDETPMYVCEAHLGWGIALSGMPALVQKGSALE